MILQLSSFAKSTSKNRARHYDSKNNNISNVNYSNQLDDTFTKSKSSAKISFAGYRGADGYGAKTDRDSAGSLPKFNITESSIIDRLGDSESIEGFCLPTFNDFVKDNGKLKKHISGLNLIFDDFERIADIRFKEIRNMNPEGSKIPLGGAIPQTAEVVSGRWREKIKQDVTNLIDDFIQVRNKYLKKSTLEENMFQLDKVMKEHMVCGEMLKNFYATLGSGEIAGSANALATLEFTDEAERIQAEEYKGWAKQFKPDKDSLQLTKDYSEQITKVLDESVTDYKNFILKLGAIHEKIGNIGSDVIEDQNIRQAYRTVRKIITWGIL